MQQVAANLVPRIDSPIGRSSVSPFAEIFVKLSGAATLIDRKLAALASFKISLNDTLGRHRSSDFLNHALSQTLLPSTTHTRDIHSLPHSFTRNILKVNVRRRETYASDRDQQD